MKKYLEWAVIVICVFMIYRLVSETYPHWSNMWSDLKYNLNALLDAIGG